MNRMPYHSATIYHRDVSGRISSLPKLYIDCGMGFERLVSIVQGLHSTYDTDLFLPLIEIIHKVRFWCFRI